MFDSKADSSLKADRCRSTKGQSLCEEHSSTRKAFWYVMHFLCMPSFLKSQCPVTLT